MTSPLIVTVKEGTAQRSSLLPTAFRQIERWAADPTNAMLTSYRARYYRNGALNTTTGASTLVYDTLVYDTRKAYNPSTGIFTCIYPGFYAVRASYSVNASASGEQIFIDVQHNGVSDATGNAVSGGALSTWVEIYTEILCRPQDTIRVQMSTPGGALAVRVQNNETFVIVEYRGG